LKRKKRIAKKRAIKKQPISENTHRSPIVPGFSSLNISKMLSHFVTFRSAIRDLSSSIQRMEKILDTTYQMFEIVQNVMNQRHHPPIQSLLPPDPESQHSFEAKEEFPLMKLPKEENESAPPFSQLLRQIDPNIIIQILQSPIVQRFLSQFLAAPNKVSPKINQSIHKRKQG